VLRSLLCALLALASVSFGESMARAADLRLTFAELTGLVQSIAGNSKVYLNNVPGGLFSTGSYISLAGQQRDLPISAQTFSFLGSTYGYYVSDVSSTSLQISPISGGLRLRVAFEDDGPELVGRCVEGSCGFEDALPVVEWPGAGALIDFEPVQFNGSVSLRVKNVQLLGNPRAVCRADVGFGSRAECSAARYWADRAIARARNEIGNTIKDAVNKPEIQAQLADGLKKYLSLGPAGAIAINNLTLEPKSMVVKFKFAAGG